MSLSNQEAFPENDGEGRQPQLLPRQPIVLSGSLR